MRVVRTTGPAEAADIPHPLTRPTRWPVVLGFLGLIAGWFMPWATSPHPILRGGTAVLTADSKGGDGMLAVCCGLALAGMAISRQVAVSQTRTVQLAPAILGIVIVGIILPTLEWTRSAVDQAIANGSVASIGPGVTVESVAAGLCAFGGLAVTIDLARTHPVLPDPTSPRVIDFDLVSSIAVGAVGIGLGFWLAGEVNVLLGSRFYSERMPLLLTVGTLLGPTILVWTWRRLLRFEGFGWRARTRT